MKLIKRSASVMPGAGLLMAILLTMPAHSWMFQPEGDSSEVLAFRDAAALSLRAASGIYGELATAESEHSALDVEVLLESRTMLVEASEIYKELAANEELNALEMDWRAIEERGSFLANFRNLRYPPADGSLPLDTAQDMAYSLSVVSMEIAENLIELVEAELAPGDLSVEDREAITRLTSNIQSFVNIGNAGGAALQVEE